MNKLLTLILLVSSAFCFGQYDMDEASDTTDQKEDKIDKVKLKEHIYVGGELSLSFGNPLYMYIGPMAGYEFYKGASAGVQAMYQLQRFNLANTSSISSHAFGGGIFARYRPPIFPYVLAQIEFDLFNTEDFTTLTNSDRTATPAIMAGLGYAGGFDKAYFHIMLMYDFVNDPNMPLPKFFSNTPLYIKYGMVFYLG